ncbi:coiled-coil domain-containing protein 40-like, partial [Oratosquilla oratoria]|uniref:coiled-coil domain-containing protein 40-like n=1 Tax=Oratosquilla oratoria TaxID=337810 RepID=UPI003F76DC14
GGGGGGGGGDDGDGGDDGSGGVDDGGDSGSGEGGGKRNGEGDGADAGGAGRDDAWHKVLATLGPDHPLLKPFQEAKRKQMLKEKDEAILRRRQLTQQLQDLENESTTIGTQLYHLQQSITRAQVGVDRGRLEGEGVHESCQEANEKLWQMRQEGHDLYDQLTQARRQDRVLRSELDGTERRLAWARAARDHFNSDVTTLRRATDKTAWDRAAFEKDKLTQDLYVERLTMTLRREEETMEALKKATKEARDEALALRTVTREQTEEHQVLQSERDRIRREWEDNLLALRGRGEHRTKASELLQKELGELAGARTSLTNCKKEVSSLQLQHEQLSLRNITLTTYRQISRERDLGNLRDRLDRENEEVKLVIFKRDFAANELEEEEAKTKTLQRILESISWGDGIITVCQLFVGSWEVLGEAMTSSEEVSFKKCHAENQRVEELYRLITRVTTQLRALETEGLGKIHQHTVSSNALVACKKKLHDVRLECQKLEDDVVEGEQRVARAALAVSDVRAAVTLHKGRQTEASKEVDQLGLSVSKLEKDLTRGQERINANMHSMHRYNNEIEKIIKISGEGEDEETVLAREERFLRTRLSDEEKEHQTKEQEALTLQKHILGLHRVKGQLNQSYSKMEEELKVLRERGNRLESNVSAEHNTLHHMRKTQDRLHQHLSTLDTKLHHEKLERDRTTHETNFIEAESMAKLQDLETEAVRKEGEVERMEVDRGRLEEQLMDSTYEIEAWERRLSQLKEAKQQYDSEKGAEGELQGMKKEINRMRSRWNALETTQRDLVSRLTQSVSVEDALRTRARASVERLQKDPNSMKATLVMQQDILRRKIVACKKNKAKLEEDTSSLGEDRQKTEDEVRRKERQYARDVAILQESALQLEDLIVRKQETSNLDPGYIRTPLIYLSFLEVIPCLLGASIDQDFVHYRLCPPSPGYNGLAVVTTQPEHPQGIERNNTMTCSQSTASLHLAPLPAPTHRSNPIPLALQDWHTLQEKQARSRHLNALKDGRYKTLAAHTEEGQSALQASLNTRNDSYIAIVNQLEIEFPQLEKDLRNVKVLLHTYPSG